MIIIIIIIIIKGRKIGVVQLTLKFWNEKEYESLGKTAQNLRDKLAHLEKNL